jgi:multisubunit Na+/H+ antiporter MnhB subunit
MNASVLLTLDVLLLVALTGLAWAAVTAADARRSVILFMAFGMVLALVWARLLAPDVALAEAAIGAGLSGALLLAAVDEQPGTAPTGTGAIGFRFGVPVVLPWLVTLLSLALALSLAWGLAQAFNDGPRNVLPEAVSANLADSGVSNPVTAVLLNFRAYDTLLELAVLLSAVLGIFALGRERSAYRPAGPVFEGLARWLTPVLILTAGYLLWVGAHAPGGAFQAGATLGAAAVVLRLAGHAHIGLPAGGWLRLVIAGGVGVFLLVGMVLLLFGRPFLGYPPAWAGVLILLIETAAMAAIAATLALAFLGGRPVPAPVSRPSPGSTKSPATQVVSSVIVPSDDDTAATSPAARLPGERTPC